MQILRQKHSKNYDLRPQGRNSIKYIVLHYTELSFDDAIDRLCDPKAKVSSHYLIKKNGYIYQLIGDFYRAWHAGISSWQGEEALNNSSIGIEIDNLGNEPFTDEQMNSVIELCKLLMKKHRIFANNIIGHSDIAPYRKIDPGLYFDWYQLSLNGIGLPFPKNNNELMNFIEPGPSKVMQIQNKLNQIGYAIEVNGLISKSFSDVIRAFQLHFNPNAIIAQGGQDFLMNLGNYYKWDENSDKILGLLTS